MRSIRGSLRTGLILSTVLAFVITGAVLDFLVNRALMNDLDASLRERARWVASTVELTEEGLELGFRDFEMGAFAPGPDASYLQLWRPDGGVLFRSASLRDRHLPRPGARREDFSLERAADALRLRTYRTRFVARVDPEFTNAPAAPVVELAVAGDLTRIDALVKSLDAMILLIGVAAALVMLLVLRYVVARSLRPMDRVAAEIANVDANDLDHRVADREVPRELAPIVIRLNEMLDRLREAFERERTFSADIAHELRTPLAGLRSALEVELVQARDPARYQQAIRESLSIVLRMQDLVQTLLQLARLDAGLVTAEPIAAELSDLTRASLEPLRSRAAARRLTLETAFDRPSSVHSDPLLLGTAIRNLLDNAIEHADEGGRVQIAVAADGDGVCLRILNSGARFAQYDVPRLFDRFVRGDASRSSHGGHHGLGLALVRRIGETLGCRLDVRSEVGGDFVVTLAVPRSGPPAPSATGPIRAN